MAGDWIKVETCTPDKQEILLMSEVLGLDSDAILGKLIRVWIWADQHTMKGHAPGMTFALLNRISGVSGFAEAMVGVGWLRLSSLDQNLFRLPNFERHNGQTAKARGLAAKRQSRSRNARSVTLAQPEKRREEKRRDKKNTPLPPTGGLFIEPALEVPKALDTPEFRSAFGDWLRHRAEKKKKATPTSQRNALKALERIGVERAVAAIEFSVSKGWDGIFEEQSRGSSSLGQNSPARLRAEPGKYEGVGRAVGSEVPPETP